MKNKLLLRQVQKYLGDPEKLPADLIPFLRVVNESYEHYEKDRKMLERSIELSSDEMCALNTRLKKETIDLKKAHNELKTLFENIDDVFFSIDKIENKTLQISPTCMEIYGYSAEEFFENPDLWYEVIVARDREIVRANYPLMLTGKHFSQEYRIMRKDKTVRWVESKITPTLNENGKLIRLDGLTTDITGRKEAEKKIAQSEIRFRKLIEKSHDGIALLGVEGRLTYVSPSVFRILGYKPHELININPSDYTHPDDKDRVISLIKNLFPRFGDTEFISYRMLNKAGSWRWVRSNITNMLHEPSLSAIIFNYEDITDRVSAETQLEFDRRTRDALINSTNDLMWSFDKNIKLITANKAFGIMIKAMTGKDIESGDDLLIKEGFSSEILERWELYYKRALAGETFTVEEYSEPPIDRYSEISFHPILENAKVIGASCFSRDITASKKSVELIKESEKMLAEAQRIANFGSWEVELTDLRNIVSLKWSDETFRIFGYEKGKDESSAENFFKILHPDDSDMILAAFRKSLRAGCNYSIDHRLIRPDGSVRWVRESANIPPREKKGSMIKIIGTVQDITERKHSEEERARITSDLIQRNKDLEQFTYIISHNLRAPVANILGLSTLIQNPNLEHATYIKCLDGLVSSSKILDNVIKDLNHILQTRREISEKKESAKFSQLVENITSSIHGLIEKENAIITSDFSTVNEMFTIKSYLYSIFYNLISNSIKYRRSEERPVIEVKSNKTDSGISLTFKDNCLGIDLTTNKDKVFGLYKRFHPNVEGKGMGLYMVKTQVETLGGRVNIRSEVNKGTEITLEFDA